MRMEERMYRDPGTEPHSFFSQVICGLVSSSDRKGIICLAYGDKNNKNKKTKNRQCFILRVSCSFIIGILMNPFILLAHGQ